MQIMIAVLSIVTTCSVACHWNLVPDRAAKLFGSLSVRIPNATFTLASAPAPPLASIEVNRAKSKQIEVNTTSKKDPFKPSMRLYLPYGGRQTLAGARRASVYGEDTR